ncbi:MAG: prepilin-type N-terminal cleavage/methylation domain-containing protein [Planctomycetota bacterium]
MRKKKGFTLVELVVVLAILAILTSMALTATSGMVDQTRYEETLHLFQKIENAIFGNTQSDGPAFGFLNDIGSFPIINETCNELFYQQGIPDFAFHDTAQIYTGWNGHYLMFPENEFGSVMNIKDGWGNDILFTNDISEKYFEIRSTGGDLSTSDDDLIRQYNWNNFLYGRVYFHIANHVTNDVGDPVNITSVRIRIRSPDRTAPQCLTEINWINPESDPPSPEFDIPIDGFSGQFGLDYDLTCGLRSIELLLGSFENQIKPVRIVGGGSTLVDFTITGTITSP